MLDCKPTALQAGLESNFGCSVLSHIPRRRTATDECEETVECDDEHVGCEAAFAFSAASKNSFGQSGSPPSVNLPRSNKNVREHGIGLLQWVAQPPSDLMTSMLGETEGQPRRACFFRMSVTLTG